MRTGIHPTQHVVNYVCNSCGTKYRAYSTSSADITVEVCSNCHPFYTGEEGVIVDTYSRVDKFRKQQEAASEGATAVTRKRKKKATRSAKASEVKADKKLTLRDMLKQKN